MTFTKLFSSLTESSVWCQDDHTRLVWIAMLAMADKHGRVWASVPGLANRARVPVEAVERALGIFLAPDPHSRTKAFEGRRIEVIDGGWRLLNHAKYRALRDEEDRRAKDAERQRRCRATRHGEGVTVTPSHAIADAAPESEAKRGDAPARGASAEVPDLKQAEAMVMADGIPAGFIALAHADWTDNEGCNAKGTPKPWPAYIRTRWRYEAGEWSNGTHRGQKRNGKPTAAAKHTPDAWALNQKP
ncbi:MAG: hypothetical protein ABMA26_12120 [Limisphaerales bacterium]